MVLSRQGKGTMFDYFVFWNTTVAGSQYSGKLSESGLVTSNAEAWTGKIQTRIRIPRINHRMKMIIQTSEP
jgi:hypothetical protein